MLEKSLTVQETAQELDKISATFCGAKWSQVLFQFHLGSLHNCCLTPPQPIGLDIFNGPKIQEERADMLAGKKIEACEVCWKAEDKGYISDRMYKSAEPWAQSLYQKESKPQVKDVVPSYIELSLSNRCQFRCAYCSPENSSSLFRESEEFGPYLLNDDFNNSDYLKKSENFFLETDENPYAQAFLDWFPKIHQKLKVLRFTGGEPLLSKKLFDVFNLLIKYPSPELEIIINSNLGIPLKVTQGFIQKLKAIPTDCYQKVSFISSIDGWGEGAKIARWGLELELFEENYLTLRKAFPEAEIRFTSTLNILAFSDMKPLLVKILEWKKSQSYAHQILLMTYPLHYPSFISMNWAQDLFREEIEEVLSFMDEHFTADGEEIGFKTVERDMMLKAINQTPQVEFIQRNKMDFALFTLQHQHRKGWEMSVLPQKLRDLIHEVQVTINEDFESGTLDLLMATKCLPWTQISSSDLQRRLARSLENKSLNPWALMDILIKQAAFLPSSWFRWCYQQNLPAAGNKLLSNPLFVKEHDFNQDVLEALMEGETFCWESLNHDHILKEVLSFSTLRALKRMRSSSLTGAELLFWEKVISLHPELGHD